jgi:segregation and condensation protein A
MIDPAEEAYAVRLPDFEGPLEILLRLIEKRELEISKVALAQVADQFLEYVNQLREPEPRLLASFLVVAAKLLYIKSQALLPQPAVAPPPAEDEEDVGAELVRRLEEYRAVQAAAQHLREREGAGLRSYAHPAPLTRLVFTPATPALGLEGVTLAHLVRLVHRRMQLALPLEAPPQLIPHEITLEEKVAEIQDRLGAAPGGTVSAYALLETATSRLEVVVTFMALLELLRRHTITALQDTAFGDILIRERRNEE